MRPIDKGSWPIDLTTGKKKEFKTWGAAKPDLISITGGKYCHICEMPILNAPAVEHIKPKEVKGNKTKYENLRLHWANFLLICTYCNSRKLNQDIKLYDYYWPHKHNTAYAFGYEDQTILRPNPSLSLTEVAIANATIDLYGLDKIVDSTGGSDSRFMARLKVISIANTRKREYEKKLATLDAIIDSAKLAGFWLIWFEMFSHCPEVRLRLIEDFYVPIHLFDAKNGYTPIKRTAEM